MTMPKLRHHDNFGTARFVTFSCHQRLKLLTDEDDILVVIDEMHVARRKYGLTVLAYVIMPSHVHIVIYPPVPIRLGTVIGEIKSRSARRILLLWRQIGKPIIRVYRQGENRAVLWEQRCYDHNCRTDTDVREKINYCHNNPVRAGLVSDPGEWKWSSFLSYQEASGIIDIDALES